ncbi:hypothetical protein NMY22_g12551 [Coprinellus aureogranulatus]|nr:hypothetical protein NMY22_g12551 [Coprinellus aureogranulatus]
MAFPTDSLNGLSSSLSSTMDQNSPILFKRNLELVQREVVRVQGLAQQVYSGINGAYLPGMDPMNTKPKLTFLEGLIAELKQAIEHLTSLLRSTGVGALPLLPPPPPRTPAFADASGLPQPQEGIHVPTEAELLEYANESVKTLYDSLKRKQDSAAVVANLLQQGVGGFAGQGLGGRQRVVSGNLGQDLSYSLECAQRSSQRRIPMGPPVEAGKSLSSCHRDANASEQDSRALVSTSIQSNEVVNSNLPEPRTSVWLRCSQSPKETFHVPRQRRPSATFVPLPPYLFLNYWKLEGLPTRTSLALDWIGELAIRLSSPLISTHWQDWLWVGCTHCQLSKLGERDGGPGFTSTGQSMVNDNGSEVEVDPLFMFTLSPNRLNKKVPAAKSFRREAGWQ